VATEGGGVALAAGFLARMIPSCGLAGFFSKYFSQTQPPPQIAMIATSKTRWNISLPESSRSFDMPTVFGP
jgi:hypothetical protein